MKVLITSNTYSFGKHRKQGDKDTLTDKQGQKLIKRGLAKEFKKGYETKELKVKKETKNASNKN